MITYIFSFLFLSFNALNNKKFSSISYILTLMFFLILIGFRFEIGMDWELYLKIMKSAQDISFFENFSTLEPSYHVINWIGAKFDQILIVNTISAFIFLLGLISYAKRQPYPWLSLIIAFPVLILISGLGFTRQSCAIGIEFFSFNAMEEKKYIKAILLILFASSFHISAIFLLLLFTPEIFRNIFKPKFLIPFVTVGIIFFYYFYESLEKAFSNYYILYVLNKFDLAFGSSGTIFRLLPTFFAALILIFNKKQFYPFVIKETINLYLRISYLVILFFFIVILIPKNTTYIDRFSIYLYPLTIFVFNKTVDFKFLNISRFDYHLIYIISYFIYTFIWLLTAVHLDAYVPYKNYLFL